MGAPSRPLASRTTALRIALVPVLLAGCAGALHPMPQAPIEDAMPLLALVRARADHLGTMAAEARLAGRSDRGRAQGRVSILADAALRHLRIDAWTPTDDLIAALVATPQGFHYFERGDRVCLTGPSCRDNLRLLLPLGLDLGDAIRALFGVPPGVEHDGPWEIHFDRRLGAYRLQHSPTPKRVVRVWVREDGRVLRGERRKDDRLEYRMDFGSFDSSGAPNQIEFQSSTDHARIQVRIREREDNPALEPEDWEPTCPRGASIRWMPCGETP